MNPQRRRPDATVFIASLRMGGAERAAVLLVNGLAKRNMAVDLVVVRAEGPLRGEAAPEVGVVDLGAARMATAVPRLAGYLRFRQPSVLLASVTHACVAAVAATQLARTGTPTVLIEQSTVKPIAARSRLRRDRMAPSLVRRLYPAASAIVAVSEGVATELAELSPEIAERITVVPNPVVTPAMVEAASAPLEHEWFRPRQPPVVLGVGRLVAEKDFETLVRAFALLRQRRRARLVVLGDGPERRPLLAQAAQLDAESDVSLPGPERNPYRYMARAAVVVSSSRVEGLPTVLIEALAVGAAVVATDCRSGPREILDGGRLGRLVPVADTVALADAIDDTLDDAGTANDRSARIEAAQRYDVDRVVDRYHDLISVVTRQASHHNRS